MTVTTVYATTFQHIAAASPTGNMLGQNVRSGEVAGSAGDEYRSLMSISFAAIPPSHRILGATMYLYKNLTMGDIARIKRLYRLRVSWVPAEVTWRKRDSSTNWTAEGAFDPADCEQDSIGQRSFTANPADGWYSFDLTASAIKDMISGALTNNGFAWITETEFRDCLRFDGHAQDNPPYIEVTHLPPPRRVAIL